MKFDHNPRYTTIAIYAFLVLAAAMLFSEAIVNLETLFGWIGKIMRFVQPVIYGCIFAFLLNPMLRQFDDHLLPMIIGERLSAKRRRSVAMLLTYLVAIFAIAGFSSVVVPQIATSLTSLGAKIPEYFEALNAIYNNLNHYFNETKQDMLVGDVFSDFVVTVMESIFNSLKLVTQSAVQYLSQSFGALITATTRFTTTLMNIILGMIVSVYILFDREKLFAQLNKIVMALVPRNAYTLLCEIGSDCHRILSGFVIGKVIDSIIIGIICFAGLSLMGMPYVVLISVIVGVTNVIPYFGPFIGAIPSFLIIFIENPVRSFWFLVFILLLQQFDGNILGPKILGDTVGLSALWIIFSIMLFSGLFGVMGMFIGVPLFAIIYSLFKRFIAFLLARKGLSTDTRSYDSTRNKLIK